MTFSEHVVEMNSTVAAAIVNINGTDSEDDDDDDDDDENDEDRINIMDGLSADVLAALLEFQLGGDNSNDDEINNNNKTNMNANNNTKIGKDTLCATYRPEDASRIAETLRRLHDRDHGSSSNNDKNDMYNDTEKDDNKDTTNGNNSNHNNNITELVILPMVETIKQSSSFDSNSSSSCSSINIIQQLVQKLDSDGVIRINNVVSSNLCNLCNQYINESLESVENNHNKNEETTAVSESFMFGNVFERNYRYDMYLHPSKSTIVQEILQSVLHKQSILGQLFQQLLLLPHKNQQAQHSEQDDDDDTTTARNIPIDAEFHELSCLVSDPGSIAQPIHPDAKYYPLYAPLWTVFIALQDISQDMGGTVVVPTTHTEQFHNLTNQQQPAGKDIRTVLREGCQFYRADLNIGDCIVMDARTFHYGGANISTTTSNRRTLFYFTIRNPYHKQRGYPNCNSIYPELDGTLKLLQYY